MSNCRGDLSWTARCSGPLRKTMAFALFTWVIGDTLGFSQDKSSSADHPAVVDFTTREDHQHMLDQLGITRLRQPTISVENHHRLDSGTLEFSVDEAVEPGSWKQAE